MAAFAGAGPRGDTGRRGTSILAAGGWSNCCLRHASAENRTELRPRTRGPRFGASMGMDSRISISVRAFPPQVITHEVVTATARIPTSGSRPRPQSFGQAGPQPLSLPPWLHRLDAIGLAQDSLVCERVRGDHLRSFPRFRHLILERLTRHFGKHGADNNEVAAGSSWASLSNAFSRASARLESFSQLVDL